MQQKTYELSVLVNGRPIREYGHHGLTFIEGRKDQPYTIRFRNNSARRVLAVISVDGLDVVDGKPATQESRGYIVPAYCSTEVKGWRTSLKTVHDFVFTGKPEGYSAQTQGDDTNSGVIAVKIFDEFMSPAEVVKLTKVVEHHHHHHHHERIIREWSPPWNPNPIIYCSTTSAMGEAMQNKMGAVGGSSNNSVGATLYSYSLNNASAGGTSGALESSPPPPEKAVMNPDKVMEVIKAGLMHAETPKQDVPDFNLGTGWGSERNDEVTETKFKRGEELCSMELYYSDADGLRKSGIEVDKSLAITKAVLPKGFNGFCVPPKVVKTT